MKTKQIAEYATTAITAMAAETWSSDANTRAGEREKHRRERERENYQVAKAYKRLKNNSSCQAVTIITTTTTIAP